MDSERYFDDPPVYEITTLAVPISLYQDPDGLFTVVYGKQIDAGLGYALACNKLGGAILHALACDGKLDND